MSLLDVTGLNLSFGPVQVLKDVSLSIRRGECLGLVGESGSGKSMTALSIMRLLPQTARREGSIRLDGTELTDLSEAHMCHVRGRDIAMVFQEPMTALNPVKTIGAQVAESLQWHARLSRRDAWRRAEEVLEQVGLPAAKFSLHRYPHQLSGGQRQRVVIAIAIALKPSLLVADEPTTALDVTIQAQILDLLKNLSQANNMALLLITHDLGVVAQMADRVAIMKQGEIVEENATLPLFRQLRHPYTRRLFEASSHVPVRIKPPVLSAAMDGKEPLLKLDNLTRDYRLPRRSIFRPVPHFRAVDGVSLDLYPGQSLGLVGESGCGKSTLARTILALEEPSGGTVRFLDMDVFALPRNDRNKVHRHAQAVFQDPYGSFDPRQTVARLVGEPLHLLGHELGRAEKQRRIIEALTDVGLEAADAGKYPHEFSGGQRQRLAIARALITHPKLIVADEPVSALDVSIRAQILDLLCDLRERHDLAYLFISHDLSVVRAITDEVLVMLAGKIVERGPTAEVFDRPAHDYTRTLIAAAPDLKTALNQLEANS